MKAQTFNCPGCLAKLTKSAQAFVLGEISHAHLPAPSVQSVPCPACGYAIDVQKMIAGAYDTPADSPLGWLVILGIFGIGGAAFLEKRGMPFWPAFFGTIVALVVLGAIGAWLSGDGNSKESEAS